MPHAKYYYTFLRFCVFFVRQKAKLAIKRHDYVLVLHFAVTAVRMSTACVTQNSWRILSDSSRMT